MTEPWDIKADNGQNVTENRLHQALIDLDLYPETQYKISDLTVDFAFPESRLVIEINGPYHDTDEQKKKDKKRLHVLNRLGWKRRTYRAKSTYEHPDVIAGKIKVVYEKMLSSHPVPTEGPEGDENPLLEALLIIIKSLFFISRMILGILIFIFLALTAYAILENTFTGTWWLHVLLGTVIFISVVHSLYGSLPSTRKEWVLFSIAMFLSIIEVVMWSA